jgi:dolichol-phosphate mannosyltransferase
VYLFGGLGMFLALLGGGAILYLVLIQQILGVGIGTRPLLQLGVVTLLVGVQFIGVGLIAALFRHMVAAREEPYRIRQTRP